MPIDTHCLPAGSLGTGQIPMSNVSAANISTLAPNIGSRRGICVFIQGLALNQFSTFPLPIPSGGTTGFFTQIQQFANAIAADGWVFEYPSCPEDYALSGAIYNDVANDPGHGSRYLNIGTFDWFDHLTAYHNQAYGPNRPVILAGFSMGGFKSLQIAANYLRRDPQANVIGYISHCPATILENADPIYTGGFEFANIDWSGLNLTPTSMTNVAIPGIIGYGTADQAVGCTGTTFTGTATDVATLRGSQSLSVASTTSMVVGASVYVPTTAPEGAFIQFTSGGGGGTTLGNCLLLRGSGTISNGAPVTQSYATQIITNPGPGGITANPTGDTHEFTSADAITYSAWIASTFDSLYPVSF